MQLKYQYNILSPQQQQKDNISFVDFFHCSCFISILFQGESRAVVIYYHDDQICRRRTAVFSRFVLDGIVLSVEHLGNKTQSIIICMTLPYLLVVTYYFS